MRSGKVEEGGRRRKKEEEEGISSGTYVCQLTQRRKGGREVLSAGDVSLAGK